MAYEPVKRNNFNDPDPVQLANHVSKYHSDDVQDFHIPLERMHNSNLHDWGIARGLEVSGTIDSTEIVVNPGVAIDRDGQLISLSSIADIGENPQEGESTEVIVPVHLSTESYAGKTVYVTIQFLEKLRDNDGVLGRWEQVPWVRLQPVEAYDGKSIVLAIAVFKEAGKLAELKTMDNTLPHRRRLIGECIEELRIKRSSKIGNEVRDILSGKIGPGEEGGLKITVPYTQDSIVFAKEDGSNFADLEIHANVGIGTTTPQAGLHIDKANTNDLALLLSSNGPGWGSGIVFKNKETEYGIYAGYGQFKFCDAKKSVDRLIIDSSGNIGVGTTSSVSNARLDIQGGGLNIGGSGNLDAAIHVKASYGGFDRLLQMSPTGASKPGLNLLASRDANNNEQWWVWGVDKDNRWKIQPGTDFSGESGLSIDSSGTIRLFRKSAFQGHDSFLRINQDNEFPSGTHFAYRANFARGITTGNWWDVEPGWGNLLVQGNVGIGTTSPRQKLDIEGNIRIGGSYTYLDGYSTRSDINRIDTHRVMAYGTEALLFTRFWEGGHNFKSVSIPNGWGFSAPSKNFLIDHPLHPDTHELVHSTLEGPEIAVFYRGEGQLSNGETTISLPDYFEALTRKENRTVLLTPKFKDGTEVSMLAASEVKDGKFTVKMIDNKNPSQQFYWEVKAVRADVEILEVERVKTLSNK